MGYRRGDNHCITTGKREESQIFQSENCVETRDPRCLEFSLKQTHLEFGYTRHLDSKSHPFLTDFNFRRMRKLAWYESILVLLFIGTIAHYLMMWAAYFEKTLVYKQNVKKSRKGKKEDPTEIDKQMKEALEEFIPKYSELLPIILAKGTVNLCKNLFLTAKDALTKQEPIEEEPTEEELAQLRRQEKRAAAAPQQPEFKFEVAQGLKAVSTNDPEMEKKYAKECEVVSQSECR